MSNIKHNGDLLSYATFLKDRDNFRRSGTRTGEEFNKFETPTNQYFKILFYFRNHDSSNNPLDGGLLAPTWMDVDKNDWKDLYNYNSAWSYLMLNGEDERADKLKQFITLLSNISSKSPWFFSSLSGLDGALERPVCQSSEFKIEEERKKISIKCLPDSFDNRIGTLLDLYRDIVWSWQDKCEIIPSNLRKFDMGIFLFSDAVKNIHTPAKDKEATVSPNTSGFLASYKYIEFHNCEFDYNSAKSPYGELSNQEGFTPEYTIEISFDDVYENRYNEFMIKTIGDIIMADLDENTINSRKDELETRINAYRTEGFLENALNEAVGAGKSLLKTAAKSIFLGNLFTLSPKTAIQQAKNIANGHAFEIIHALDDYKEHIDGKISKKSAGDLGNLFKSSSKAKNI